MERVLEECERADKGFDAEAVHDLRVVLRRCRSLADGLIALDPDSSWKDMKKAGKKVFQALGELRDMQVMEEWIEKLNGMDDSAKEQPAQDQGSRSRLQGACSQGSRSIRSQAMAAMEQNAAATRGTRAAGKPRLPSSRARKVDAGLRVAQTRYPHPVHDRLAPTAHWNQTPSLYSGKLSAATARRVG
jgi:CHAD domain-containing protein